MDESTLPLNNDVRVSREQRYVRRAKRAEAALRAIGRIPAESEQVRTAPSIARAALSDTGDSDAEPLADR